MHGSLVESARLAMHKQKLFYLLRQNSGHVTKVYRSKVSWFLFPS